MIVIVDYGVGNVGSALNMIKKVGGKAKISSKSKDVQMAEKILLPGVGSFDTAMSKLDALGLITPLRDSAAAETPLFGICLGMQLLAFTSEEGKLPGLGLIPGAIRHFKFDKEKSSLRIPHMGWNHVSFRKKHQLTKELGVDSKFYFVHSFHYECENPSDVLCTTHYGYEFTSGIQKGNIMGVQFHPEKSHRFGIQLFKNFIEL